jgi:hypothetical protein
VDHFGKTQNGAFAQTMSLSGQFVLDAEIYVDKTRFGIEKLVREVKNPKKG